MKYIGLTGGIGSGKSVIAKIFECLQIPVYYSDIRAKQLMNTHEDIRNQLVDLVGEKVYSNNILQTHILAQALFSDVAIKNRVDSIVHPIVRNDFFEWAQLQCAPYVILESALMFQTNLYTYFSEIIFVDCNKQTRIQRVMARDGLQQHEVEKRIQMQPDDEFCKQKSQYIIENNNTFVIPQVLNVHAKIINK
ncbi:MAG TPA: dephospho-CoA kinase [Bacteroidales bacterium]|nr:dephospho-CoA kinase [Bacteroidales bacterium]